MVFIAGVPFEGANLVRRSLQSFYGIGPNVCKSMMARLGIHDTAKILSLKEQQVINLNAELTNMKLDNDLRRQIRENISKLHEIGSYRGKRHAKGLPVRGQCTRTQISTARRLNRVARK